MFLIIFLAGKVYSQFDYDFADHIIKKYYVDSSRNTYQRMAWYLSTTGDYLQALKYWDRQEILNKSSQNIDSLFEEKLLLPNPNKIVIDAAKNYSITLINEAHHVPFNRTFTRGLLKDLFINGYRYIGFESLSKYDSLINKRKYPINNSGYYIREPEFSLLIYEALEIGYKVFGYDSQAGDFDKREFEQAENIIKNIDLNKGKVLIHGGYSHIREDSIKKKRMGFYLKKLIHNDILTVDQTYFLDHFDTTKNKFPFSKINLFESKILLKGDSITNLILNNNGTDMIIVHPKQFKIDKRLWYVNINKDKIKYYLPKKYYKERNLILVYPDSFYSIDSKANPVEIVELSINEKTPLFLKKGNYKIKIVSENLNEKLLSVKIQ